MLSIPHPHNPEVSNLPGHSIIILSQLRTGERTERGDWSFSDRFLKCEPYQSWGLLPVLPSTSHDTPWKVAEYPAIPAVHPGNPELRSGTATENANRALTLVRVHHLDIMPRLVQPGTSPGLNCSNDPRSSSADCFSKSAIPHESRDL
jgi:hypothetical protein